VKLALLQGAKFWECPNCDTTDCTSVLTGNRFHTCPGLHNLVAPLVVAGTDCKIVALPREDYLAGEVQRRGSDGRPYGGVRTERADGSNDLAMFAPLAQASAKELR
jgi:hypothetical protein